MEPKQQIADHFRLRYHKDPERIFFCPGRVNLIGEHIDYNGGHVLPCAISFGTWLAIARNNQKRLRFQCLSFPEVADLYLQSSYSKSGPEWFNYPLAVIDRLLQDGHALSGYDMLFDGDLPIGAGLSSSASIEVLTAFALNEISAFKIPLISLALLCKEAENKFIGVNCGIMDQFAVAMGRKEQALLLNCDSLEYEYIPFRPGPYVLLIIDTKKQRTLADSKYNERFAECGAVLNLLMQEETGIRQLCDISPVMFERNRDLINNPVLEKRAWHVISEQQRVMDAVMALQVQDMETFGKLLFSSHQSLKEYYEVTGTELDCVVDFCKKFSGCIGARMTGAGFGGSAIALVNSLSLRDFTSRLVAHYEKEIGYPPVVYPALPSEGVHEIKF